VPLKFSTGDPLGSNKKHSRRETWSRSWERGTIRLGLRKRKKNNLHPLHSHSLLSKGIFEKNRSLLRDYVSLSPRGKLFSGKGKFPRFSADALTWGPLLTVP